MKQLLKENKGYLTVESVFILIYVIGVVFLLVHIAHGIYQKAYMQAVADEAVVMAQRYWLNSGKDFRTGKIKDAENVLYAPLYRYPFDWDQDTKEKEVEKYVSLKLRKVPAYNVFKYEEDDDLEIKCDALNYGVYRKIVVTISDTKKSPFAVFRKLFLLSETRTLEVRSEGVVHDPAEYIRNLDLGKDLILETEQGQAGVEKIGEWRDKLSECLSWWKGDSEDAE